MKGKGIAFGAISIVNALVTGKGAAIGAKLKTEAEVELYNDNNDVIVEIDSDHTEIDKELAKFIVNEIMYTFKKKFGAKILTKSEIPIARGLKSSSAASNAIVLATLAALGINLEDQEIINIGVDASLRVGVSVTGAFDDASASYYGGIIVTDNFQRKIILKENSKDYSVVIYVPSEKSYTKNVDLKKMKVLRSLFEEAYNLALKGQFWEALTFNGLLCSSLLGYDSKPIIDALDSGAIAAGLSGKGPSIAAICREEDVRRITSAWKHLPGQIILTQVNNQKAEATKID